MKCVAGIYLYGAFDWCFYHVTYTFQSILSLQSCLNVKALLDWNRRNIWCLSDCNGAWTHNHLLRKGLCVGVLLQSLRTYSVYKKIPPEKRNLVFLSFLSVVDINLSSCSRSKSNIQSHLFWNLIVRNLPHCYILMVVQEISQNCKMFFVKRIYV